MGRGNGHADSELGLSHVESRLQAWNKVVEWDE